MLTPVTSASSTSAPSVIILKARSTQVTPCSSFERLPLEEATTHGLVPPVFTAGACPKSGLVAEAAATPAAAVVRTKSRRFTFLIRILAVGELVSCWIDELNSPVHQFSKSPISRVRQYAGGDDHTLRFGSSLVNFCRAHVAEQALDDRPSAVAGGRQDLHRLVGGFVPGLRSGEFRHRRLHGALLLAILGSGRLQGQHPRRRQLGR